MRQAMAIAAERGAPNSEIALEISGLCARYGKRSVLNDINIHVGKGEIVSVLGHNGAGKTTLLQSIIGMTRDRSGTVWSFGKDISSQPYYRNTANGITLTPADSPVFRALTVEANLRLGAYSTSPPDLDDRLEGIFETFPRLRERRVQLAGTLSGGEQRMLAVGMAVANRPRLMLLDEPSIGLAPATAGKIMTEIKRLSQTTGTSILLVDQNVRGALRVSSRVYFLRMGEIILEETAAIASKREHFWDLF